MTETISVLDHGFVKFIESWGSDERIIEAARMSTGKGFRSWYPYFECPVEGCGAWWFPDAGERPCHHDAEPRFCKVGDNGLLKFLWSKQHTTPFEMAGTVAEVQAPIMVFREWHRHRTFSYNEMSARYAPLPDVNYVPTVARCLRNAGKNKQAAALSTAPAITEGAARDWLFWLEEEYKACEKVYQAGLMRGVPKELARLILPVGRYSRMRASANLLNWLKFLKLRYASDAQWEIMKFAEAIKTMLAERFPRVLELVDLPAVE